LAQALLSCLPLTIFAISIQSSFINSLIMENLSAWITQAAAYPFVVKDGPKPQPAEGQVLIRNVAVAIVSLYLP
jgi:hypothetical protein